MKILCVGRIAYDITIPTNEYPIENEKYQVIEKVEGIGGSAAIAACLLSKWNTEVLLSGVIGSDQYGTKIKETLQRIHMETRYVETNYEKATNTSFIICNSVGQTRTIFNLDDQTLFLKKYDVDLAPDIIFVDGKEYMASKAILEKNPRAISIIDAGSTTNETIELAKRVKYIVCSKSFAENLTNMKVDYKNTTTLVDIYQKLKHKYPNAEIIITLEEKGALYCINNQIKVMPGLNVIPKDTTGAGDIFHGAFVYGLANGFDLEKTIRYANIAGGLSTLSIGSFASIPALEDVVNYDEKKQA